MNDRRGDISSLDKYNDNVILRESRGSSRNNTRIANLLKDDSYSGSGGIFNTGDIKIKKKMQQLRQNHFNPNIVSTGSTVALDMNKLVSSSSEANEKKAKNSTRQKGNSLGYGREQTKESDFSPIVNQTNDIERTTSETRKGNKNIDIKIQDESEQQYKFEILKNIGYYEKESTAMLKSGIISIQNLLETDFPNRLNLVDKIKTNLSASMQGESSDIIDFIKSSTNTEILKSTLSKLHKDSKSIDTIFSHCLFKDKDSAIRTLFSTLSLIEVLWGLMIAYET